MPYPTRYEQPHPNPAPPDLLCGSWADILHAFNIVDWDAVIIGDGSGSGWSIGAGWSSVVTLRNLRRSPILAGGFNYGTVNIAETMAVYQGLMWLDSNGAAELKKLRNTGWINVHVISDSELVVNQGNMKAGCTGPNRTIWRAVRDYEREGWRLKFHWCPRDQIQLNRLCDHASREARLAVQAINLENLLQTPDISEYDFNPMAERKER